MTIYLDCNATTPMEPAVTDLVMHFLTEEFGNAGSRTHEFGLKAKRAVDVARDQVASVVAAEKDEIFFTSGATESNNLALLGLASHGESTGRRHIVATSIEHKAVLEPLGFLASRGFEVRLVAPNSGGWVEPAQIQRALREDTLLVSVMHVNNETGVVQPLGEIGALMAGHQAYLHTDAAQGFGKDIAPLRNPRIDLISISGHKIYGPKGVGALVARRRDFKRPPLQPLVYGGGQEKGLRPGTLPVPLVAGLGLAAELANKNFKKRNDANANFRERLLDALTPLRPVINGDPERCLPNTLNVSFPGIDSEAIILALKGIAAVSNGSACTSANYKPSHVLSAMGLSEDRIAGATRLSWSHLTPEFDLSTIAAALSQLS